MSTTPRDNNILDANRGRNAATVAAVVATAPQHGTSSATLNYDRNYYQSLLKRVNYELKTIQQQHQPSSSSHNSNNNNNILQEARELVSKVGLSIESDLRNINIVTTSTAIANSNANASVASQKEPSAMGTSSSVSTATNIPVSTTTGGYSNTDHIIARTGWGDRTDRINEYRRQYMIRQRTVTNSETKLYTQKWDKHRVMGERRRRIIRDIDLPNAPTEPPPSGYIIFLGQMTTKLRYDSYKRDTTKRVKHDQTKMVQEISNMWKSSLDDTDREYYHNFYMELKKEYQQQLMEYRATGYYTPSTRFIRNHMNVGLWTHIATSDKNALEMEIATYDTIQFPSTHLDEEEQLRRIHMSKEKRKRKIQQEREALLQKQLEPSQSHVVGLSMIQRRRRRRSHNNNDKNDSAATNNAHTNGPTATTTSNDTADSPK